MSVGDSPSLNFIGDTVGDTAPHSMSEMRGINFLTGNSPTTGAIRLGDFRNKTITRQWDDMTTLISPTPYIGFGYKVGISGDYAIVGGAGEDVFIYHRTGTGTWDTWTKIIASGAGVQSSDSFGRGVAICPSGNYAIVGAPNTDIPLFNSGVVYIFRRTGTNAWDTGTRITRSDAGQQQYIGETVAISGDYAIAGTAYGNDVYIFHRTGTNSWDTGIKISGSGKFGHQVAISGDYVVVGAPDADNIKGAVYIYHRTGINSWDTGTKITVSEVGVDYFYLGYSVGISVSGDYVIAGVPWVRGAYIFRRTDTNTWDAGTKISADIGAYGEASAISNDYAIVGAYGDEHGGSVNNGSALIYRRTGTNSWSFVQKIVAPNPAAGDSYGQGVAISPSGDYVIAGASGYDVGGAFIHRGDYYI